MLNQIIASLLILTSTLNVTAQESQDIEKWTLNTKISTSQSEVFIIVEQMPHFPACKEIGLSNSEKKMCSFKHLDKYVGNRITFKKDDNGESIQGTYLVKFIIDKNGESSDIELERPIKNCDSCNKDLLEIFNNMPAWIPGRQRNKEVNVLYKYAIKIGI